MKEIKKLSELISLFITNITKDENLKNKSVYSIWTYLVKKENLPLDSVLEDINKSKIIIQVNHPGSAQQIRMKANKILEVFNAKLSVDIKNIKILIKKSSNP